MNEIKLKIGCIIESENEILLIKEKYQKSSEHKWNCITGSYEVSDGDIRQAVVREIKEETGLNADLAAFFKIVQALKSDRQKVYFFFIAKATDRNVKLPSQVEQARLGEDICDYRWFSKSQISEMQNDEFVTNTAAYILKEYASSDAIAMLPLDTIRFGVETTN